MKLYKIIAVGALAALLLTGAFMTVSASGTAPSTPSKPEVSDSKETPKTPGLPKKPENPGMKFLDNLTDEQKTAIKPSLDALKALRKEIREASKPLMQDFRAALKAEDKNAVLEAYDKLLDMRESYKGRLEEARAAFKKACESVGITLPEQPAKMLEKVKLLQDKIDELRNTNDQAKISEICQSLLKDRGGPGHSKGPGGRSGKFDDDPRGKCPKGEGCPNNSGSSSPSETASLRRSGVKI